MIIKKKSFIRAYTVEGSKKITEIHIYSQDGVEERYDFINNDKIYKSFNKKDIPDVFNTLVTKCKEL